LSYDNSVSNLNNIFNKIYVISLISEVNRRNNINKIAKKFNFKFEFIDAVDYKNVDLQQLKIEKKIAFPGNDFFCTKKCTCSGSGHDIDIRAIACSLSHLKVWTLIHKNSLKNALILEDDVYFEEGLNDKLQNMEPLISKKWNYINLGRNNSFKDSKKLIQKISRGFSGTQMYGISNMGAQKAIENFYPVRAHVDGYLDYFVIQKRWGSAKLKNCYASTENLGKNGSINGKFETNIENYY
jgi:GR25 family glycosyltransferase involved in LPS biosynthesis